MSGADAIPPSNEEIQNFVSNLAAVTLTPSLETAIANGISFTPAPQSEEDVNMRSSSYGQLLEVSTSTELLNVLDPKYTDLCAQGTSDGEAAASLLNGLSRLNSASPTLRRLLAATLS